MTKKSRATRNPNPNEPQGLTIEEAFAFVRAGAQRTTRGDLDRVADHAAEIMAAFSKKPLSPHRATAKLMLQVVDDYRTGGLVHMPYSALSAIVFALDYVLNPVDIIPDFLPIIGQLDDLRIFEAASTVARRHLKATRPLYR